MVTFCIIHKGNRNILKKFKTSYAPSPESQIAIHIYHVIYENTLTLKRIRWDWGWGRYPTAQNIAS